MENKMETEFIHSIRLSSGKTSLLKFKYPREIEEAIESHRSHWVPDSKGGETQT